MDMSLLLVQGCGPNLNGFLKGNAKPEAVEPKAGGFRLDGEVSEDENLSMRDDAIAGGLAVHVLPEKSAEVLPMEMTSEEVISAINQKPELIENQKDDVKVIWSKLKDLTAFYQAVESKSEGIDLQALAGEIAKAERNLVEAIDPKVLQESLQTFKEGLDVNQLQKVQELEFNRERDSEIALGPDEEQSKENTPLSIRLMEEPMAEEPMAASEGSVAIEELWVRMQLEKGASEKGQITEIDDLLGLSAIQTNRSDKMPTEMAASPMRAGDQKLPVIEQVVDHVRGLIETLHISPQGKKSVEVQLFPPDLGKMKIEMEVVRNEIHVNMQVERSETKGLIDQNLAALRESLGRRDLKLGEINVRLGTEGQEFTGAQYAQSGMKEQLTKDARETSRRILLKSRAPVEVASLEPAITARGARYFSPMRVMRSTLNLVA